VEVAVGPRKQVIQGTPRWDDELAAQLRLLRADRGASDVLRAVCNAAEMSPMVYIRFMRVCRNAWFAKLERQTNGPERPR
jgi:hypothetical protein